MCMCLCEHLSMSGVVRPSLPLYQLSRWLAHTPTRTECVSGFRVCLMPAHLLRATTLSPPPPPHPSQTLADEQFMDAVVDSSWSVTDSSTGTGTPFSNSPWMTDSSRVSSLESVLWSMRPSSGLDLALRVAQEAVTRAHTLFLPVAQRAYEVYVLALRLPCLHSSYFKSYGDLTSAVRTAAATVVARVTGGATGVLPARFFREGVEASTDVPTLRVVGEVRAAVTWHAYAAMAAGMLGPHRGMLAVALSLRVLRAEGRISVRESACQVLPGWWGWGCCCCCWWWWWWCCYWRRTFRKGKVLL